MRKLLGIVVLGLLLNLFNTKTEASVWKFCVAESPTIILANIFLNKCEVSNFSEFKEVSARVFITTRLNESKNIHAINSERELLQKEMYPDESKTEASKRIFDRELNKLFIEFKIRKIDNKIIYETIKNHSYFASLYEGEYPAEKHKKKKPKKETPSDEKIKETTQTDSSNDIVQEEKKAKNIVDIVFCKKKNSNDIYPRLRKNLCKSGGYGVEDSSYQEYLKFYEHKRICFKKKLNQIGSFSDCYPENEIYYVKYDGNNFIIDPDQTKKGKKDPVKNNDGLLTALEETEKKLKELKGEKKETKKLNIEIKKVVEETDVIKINEAYSLKCEIEMEDANVTIVSKVVNSKKLRIEGIMSFGDDGDIFFKTDSNIKSNGKISQGKSKTDYSENFDKNLKKAMKKNEGMFTNMTSLNFNTFNLYGKTLIPIKVKDKKKSKVMLDLMKMLVKHDNELKKVIKNLKVNWYDHYLGIANIQEEKFYVLKSYLEMKHPEFGWQVVFNELYAENDTMYVLIHVDSGYTIAMASTLKPICIIYKQNKEVIKVDSSDIIY